ncbi:MAG TPA: PQQ-binding-like beta-propeller repeat protein [Polyangia bacterium]|jgi:outer membrane protein assembly factor BamB
MTAPDIAGTLLTVSSLAASGGDTLLFDMRADDAIDSNQDALPDQFLLRESVVAIDIASGDVRWTQPNGRAVVTLDNDIPKFWLCPSPAIFQSAVGPLAAVTSTLGNQARVLDVATGAQRWTVAMNAPSQVSPALANGRLFVASRNAVSGLLSNANQPPSAPVLAGVNGRTISNVAPVLRWNLAMDPEHDAVSYQLRIDHDGEVLESWDQELSLSPGQTRGRPG